MKQLFLAACAALTAAACGNPTPIYAGCVTGAEPECPVIESGHLTVTTNYADTRFNIWGGDVDYQRTIQPGTPFESDLPVGSYSWTANANPVEKSGRVTIEKDSSVGITLEFEVTMRQIHVVARHRGNVYVDGEDMHASAEPPGSDISVGDIGMTRVLEARDSRMFSCPTMLEPGNFPASTFIEQGANIQNRTCTGTRGPYVGVSVVVTMECANGEIRLCLGDIRCAPIKAYDLSHETEGSTITGGVSEDLCNVDYTVRGHEGSVRENVFDCCP